MKKSTAKTAVLTFTCLMGLPFVSALTSEPVFVSPTVNSVIDAVAPRNANAAEEVRSFTQNTEDLGTTLVTGVVSKIHDGDTITILPDDDDSYDESRRRIRVRFLGIDTPEYRQLHGPESTEVLKSMIRAGDRVGIRFQHKDRYGRTIAFVYANGKNLNYELLKNGAAWYYKHYAKDLGTVDPEAPDEFEKAEEAARSRKLGLWAEANPQAPWDWRREQRKSKANDTQAAEAGSSLFGDVSGIESGDSVTVTTADGRQHRVRLIGLDAPKSGQPYASESRAALERIIREARGRAGVIYQKKDRYDRILGLVFANDKNVNLELIRSGSARYNRRYADDLRAADYKTPAEFDAAEKEARSQRLGLWAEDNPQAPREWRKEHPQSN
jgi:endonuclease YncB( thermonuclease family)